MLCANVIHTATAAQANVMPRMVAYQAVSRNRIERGFKLCTDDVAVAANGLNEFSMRVVVELLAKNLDVNVRRV